MLFSLVFSLIRGVVTNCCFFVLLRAGELHTAGQAGQNPAQNDNRPPHLQVLTSSLILSFGHKVDVVVRRLTKSLMGHCSLNYLKKLIKSLKYLKLAN